MPSTDVFDRQPAAYRDSVLPASCTARVAVEAGASLGWYKYVGLNGRIVGLDHFGASAPYEQLYEKFGLSAENVAAVAEEVI